MAGASDGLLSRNTAGGGRSSQGDSWDLGPSANGLEPWGHTQLERDKPASGNFSLVWKKIDGTWRIVHDHSSLLAQ
ncbi:MAG: nuclear transport factor 2 family protein [Planctomycetaceae bacterium]|nr:nuclear transport factor 2 family protein [Planctomycetaceae bacterium]